METVFLEKRIESFNLNETNNTIEVVIRIPSNRILLSNPPMYAPDMVYKEIYGVFEGKIKLITQIEGKHIPATSNTEQIIFKK